MIIGSIYGVDVSTATNAHQKSSYQATVIRVVDGDSMHVELMGGQKRRWWFQKRKGTVKKIRLFGIDAPEVSQRTGPKSGRYLATRIGGEEITIKEVDQDQYGRTVAVIYDKNNKNINREMVEVGLAWVYRKYYENPEWIQLEANAKAQKIGIWRKGTPIPPWEYREKAKK